MLASLLVSQSVTWSVIQSVIQPLIPPTSLLTSQPQVPFWGVWELSPPIGVSGRHGGNQTTGERIFT